MSQPIPLRLSFIGKKERVVYRKPHFYIMRAGTDEVEISTRNDDLPFEIQFVFPNPNIQTTTCKGCIKKRFAGKNVRHVRKAVAAFELLEAGSKIELYSLRDEEILGVVELPPYSFNLPPQSAMWLDMLASISEKFEVSIKLPENGIIVQEEYASVSLLYGLATGGAVSMDNISMKLVKSAENSKKLPELLQYGPALAMVYPDATFNLFGTEIYKGGCGMQLDKWEFKNVGQILRDFEKAQNRRSNSAINSSTGAGEIVSYTAIKVVGARVRAGAGWRRPRHCGVCHLA